MVKTGKMLAIALDENYNDLEKISLAVKDFVNNAINSTHTEEETTYEIYFWNNWSISDETYEDIINYLSSVRHSFILIDESGYIIEDNKTTDENGTDELFNGMLSINYYCKFFDMEYGTEDL